MPDNRGHSLVSPSGAHSWMRCTKSPRFVESLNLPPEQDEPWAAEGTIAHWMCEQWLKALPAGPPAFAARMDCPTDDAEPVAVESGGYETAEMMPHVEQYVDYVRSQLPTDGSRYELGVEREVDLRRWVPGMFGSADSMVLRDWGPDGPQAMFVNDFKYGTGVTVPINYGSWDDPEPNPQLCLYAFGLMGPSVRTVRISIIQPRVGNLSWMDLTRDQLARAVAPAVKAGNMAYEGMGRFAPSPQTCQFCRGVAWCRAALRASGLPALADGPGHDERKEDR